MTRSITISIPPEMADCLDWLIGREQSTEEHILLALLNNGFLTVVDAISDEDFELLVDALQVTMKRYFRAEAPGFGRDGAGSNGCGVPERTC